MPLYSKLNYGIARPIDLTRDYAPTLAESMGAAFDQAMATNPLPSLNNILVTRRPYSPQDMEQIGESETIDLADLPGPAAQPMPVPAQEAKIKEAGLQGLIKPNAHYTPEAVELAIDAKKRERANTVILEKAPFWHVPATLAAGFAGGMLDPVNIASAFVPVVGEARMLSLLGRASGLAGRSLVRAAEGAASGALGAALVEPLVYSGQKSVQADYGMAQSLMNIGFGAAFGAALKPAAGLLGEFWRNRRGIAHPWEYVPQTAESREFLRNHAAEIERNLLEANPALDAEAVKANALGTALVYDAWARNYAYNTQTPVADFYGRWRIDYESGRLVERAAENVERLEQAMYRAPQKTITEFTERVHNDPADRKVSYFAIKSESLPDGLDIRLTSNAIRHQMKNHPDMVPADNEILPQIMAQINGQNTIDTGIRGAYGRRHVGMQGHDGASYGYVFDIAPNGTVYITTYFRDHPNSVLAWFEKAKKESSMALVEAGNADRRYTRISNGNSQIETLKAFVDEVKSKSFTTLNQSAEPGAAAGSPTTNATPLTHENVHSLEDLYHLAREAQPDFNASIENIARDTGAEPHFRPDDGLKKPERVQRKIDQDYAAEGPGRVLDVLGATLLYKSRDEVEAALPAITRQIEAAGGTVVRVKDRFARPSAGYKDYLINIRMKNGFVTELLLTTKAMSEAKQGPGHDLYEAGQALTTLLEDRSLTPEQRELTLAIRRELGKASRNYYESTGDQSSATASSSVISAPLNTASVLLEDMSSLSVYPKLVSLLGSIRQTLPSVASTKGISSYSTNRSTNTVPPSGKVKTRAGAGKDSPESSKNLFSVGEVSGVLDEGIAKSPLGDESITSAQNYNKLSGEKTETLFQAATEPETITGAQIRPSEVAPNIIQNQPVAGEPAVLGSNTTILGNSIKDAARYEVWELSDIIASHDPANQFARNPDYPALAQERPYHSDPGEQEKVRGNALNYQPDFVLNTDPTAANGPPIITQSGIVLGGNSRAMTLDLVYGANGEAAAAYRKALSEHAAQFGIDPQLIEGMEKPVLVRVVDGELSPEQMALKSREYNQTTTQALQLDAEAVSRGRFFSEETLAQIAAGIEEAGSLRKYAASGSGSDLANALFADGVISQTEHSKLTGRTGKLNEAGKDLLERALRGLAVPDYDVLSALPRKLGDKLDRIVVPIARLKALGKGWDISAQLTEALRLIIRAADEKRELSEYFGQVGMFADSLRDDPVMQALALTFQRAGAPELKTRLEIYLAEAQKSGNGQANLIAAPDPKTAFRLAFMKDAAQIGDYSVANYRPEGSDLMRAIAWAREKAGKKPTVAKTIETLEQKLQDTKLSPEDKAVLLGHMQELAKFDGRIEVYPADLGPFFSEEYRAPLEAPKPAPVMEEAAPPSQAARTNNAAVNFYEDGRIVVQFFKSANLSSAPHEIYHIIRRQMEVAARSRNATPALREAWRKMQDFVGARDGEKWTKEMDERFARAGERYLLEGVAPSPALAPAFEEFRRQMLEIYDDADAAGLEISEGIRSAFDDMLTLPFEKSDQEFRRAVGDLNTRQIEREFAEPEPEPGRMAEAGETAGERVEPEAQARLEEADDLASVTELEDTERAGYEQALTEIENISPEVAGEIRKEVQTELDALNQDTAREVEAGAQGQPETLYQAAQTPAQPSPQNANGQTGPGAGNQAAQIDMAAKRRAIYLQGKTRAAAVKYALENFKGMEAEGISAIMVGSKYARSGARMSIDAQGSALEGSYIGGLLVDLQKIDPQGLAYAQFKKGALDREVAKALWTIDNPTARPFTGPKDAMAIAKACHKWQERARMDQNQAGAWIGKLPGYIVRQSHDAEKIARAGFDKWADFMLKNLDWNKTAGGEIDPGLDPETARKFLGETFDNIVSGEHLKAGGDINPLTRISTVGSAAARVSRERVLHFKSGESWFDYDQRFGQGSLREAMLKGLSHAARNTALMRGLGPSPQTNLQNIISDLRKTLRLQGQDQAVQRVKRQIKTLQDQLSEIDGSINIPVNPTWAAIGRSVRAMESMAKLGGALISSISDVPSIAYELAYQGKGFFSAMAEDIALLIKGRGSLEQQEILAACGVYFDSMSGSLISRFSGNELPGKMTAMMNLFFRANGLAWWTDAHKKAVTLIMSHDLARLKNNAWGELSHARQRVLSLYGIDAGQWDILRRGKTLAADGRDYLTPL